jgi:hypothetical protein
VQRGPLLVRKGHRREFAAPIAIQQGDTKSFAENLALFLEDHFPTVPRGSHTPRGWSKVQLECFPRHKLEHGGKAINGHWAVLPDQDDQTLDSLLIQFVPLNQEDVQKAIVKASTERRLFADVAL